MELLKNCVRNTPKAASLVEQLCVFPCPGCREKLGSRWNCFCESCQARLKLIKAPCCPGCGGPQDGILEYCSKCLNFGVRPWQNAYALFELDPFGLELIHRYKYSGQVELARAFAELAVEAIRSRGDEFDEIVPIPLHWSRYLWRGFNQAHLFCALLGRELKIPVKHYLARSRATRRQAKLNREQRLKNLSGAFKLRHNNELKGRKILLVDDVLTTGATLSEACKPLKDTNITIMVIGRR